MAGYMASAWNASYNGDLGQSPQWGPEAEPVVMDEAEGGFFCSRTRPFLHRVLFTV